MRISTCFLVLVGCSTPLSVHESLAPRLGVDAEGEGEVVLSDATVLLDEQPGLLDLQVGTDQIVLLTDGTPVQVEAGDVVVGQLDGGYLRHVTEVLVQGDRVVLRTAHADLADAIREGRYHVTAEILDRAATTWDIGGLVIYSDQVWSSASGDYVQVNLHIAEGAQVTLDPQFDFDLEILEETWIDAGFEADIALSYNADIVANVSGAFQGSIEGSVLSRSIPFAFYMGSVPVVGTAHVELLAGIEAGFEGEGTATLQTSGSASVTMGASYTDSWDFQYDSSVDGDLAWAEEHTYEGQTRVWLRARLTVELYSSAGAELEFVPSIELATCPAGGFELDARLDGSQRYYFEAFGWNAFDSGTQPFTFGPWDIYAYQCETAG